ncbi:MAG: hypothetical protein ACRD2G_06180 [Terriglobia bacterium]
MLVTIAFQSHAPVAVDRLEDVNQLASQGWILAAVAPVHYGAGAGVGIPATTLDYVMKHPKQ